MGFLSLEFPLQGTLVSSVEPCNRWQAVGCVRVQRAPGCLWQAPGFLRLPAKHARTQPAPDTPPPPLRPHLTPTAPNQQLCPSDKAFKSFARASGYKTWDLMWEEITNNAERWTPYMTRIITYMHLDDVVMGAQITRKEIEVTTSLVTEVDADGNPTAYAKVLLDKVLSPWGIRKRAVISGKKRAYFVKADLIKEDGAVVHAVNKVFMPPDTYPSIKEAFSRNPELWTSVRALCSGWAASGLVGGG